VVQRPCLYVLAGTNGAGKSSVGGEMLLRKGIDYLNPDEAAKMVLAANPGLSQAEANGAAWYEGKRQIELAIADRHSLAFETTLGGHTITSLLEQALSEGMEVRIWYVALSSPELHIARVRSRVAHGGHDIPEGKIRERYNSSRLNLIRLLPKLTEFRVYDNSREADPSAGATAKPALILHLTRGRVVRTCELRLAPEWAKPILMAAMSLPD
jgi:predicted ABC-type ATPase